MRKACQILLLGLFVAVTTACASTPSRRARDADSARGQDAAGHNSRSVSASKHRNNRAHQRPKESPDDYALASFSELEAVSANAKVQKRLTGQATYYSDSLAGNFMASGERYDPRMPHAAHRTLPFGTMIRVTRISNGATVVLRVTDRGPFGSHRRILDVSREAAERLGMIRSGVADVRIEVLSKP